MIRWTERAFGLFSVSCMQIMSCGFPQCQVKLFHELVEFSPQLLAQSWVANFHEIIHLLIGEETGRNSASTRLVLRRARVVPLHTQTNRYYTPMNIFPFTDCGRWWFSSWQSITKYIQKSNFYKELFNPTITNPSQGISESFPFWQLNSPCEQSLSENFWHFAVGNWRGTNLNKQNPKSLVKLVSFQRQFPWLTSAHKQVELLEH